MRDSLGLKDLATELKQEFMQSSRDIRDAFGFEIDPELRRYQRLAERDFAVASSVFGPEKIVEYIRTMETRKMRGRRK